MIKIICPNCREKNPKIVKKEEEYSLLKCKRCKLVFKSIKNLNKKKVQELQDSVYQDVHKRLLIKMNYKMARDRLNTLTKFKRGGKLLEIGCATGEFLELAGEFGFDVIGLDASKKFSSYAIKKGLNIRYGHLEDINFEKEKFEVISMFHLIEHIEDPNKFLKQIFKCLKLGGLVFIVAPNVESSTNKIFGYSHPNFKQADHLFFYSKDTLTNSLEKTGFNILYVSSKEYSHHPFTSLKGTLIQFLKKNANYVPSPVPNTKSQDYNSLVQKIIKQSPYFFGALFYPILKPYGFIAEKNIRGHELIIVAQKPQ